MATSEQEALATSPSTSLKESDENPTVVIVPPPPSTTSEGEGSNDEQAINLSEPNNNVSKVTSDVGRRSPRNKKNSGEIKANTESKSDSESPSESKRTKRIAPSKNGSPAAVCCDEEDLSSLNKTGPLDSADDRVVAKVEIVAEDSPQNLSSSPIDLGLHPEKLDDISSKVGAVTDSSSSEGHEEHDHQPQEGDEKGGEDGDQRTGQGHPDPDGEDSQEKTGKKVILEPF